MKNVEIVYHIAGDCVTRHEVHYGAGYLEIFDYGSNEKPQLTPGSGPASFYTPRKTKQLPIKKWYARGRTSRLRMLTASETQLSQDVIRKLIGRYGTPF